MKLAPLSVPYRAAEKGAGLLFTAAVIVFSGTTLSGVDPLVRALLAGAGLLAVVAAVAGYEVAYYRRFAYELTADTLDIRSGVVARRRREIPLRRIQNVDVSQNALQRALGIAAVDFETAGGDATEAAIRYVSPGEAERLQREIRRLKRGATAGAAEDADVAETLFALSPRELALVGLLSFDLRYLGTILFLLSGSVPFVPSFLRIDAAALLLALSGVAVLVAVTAVAWLLGVAVAVTSYYGFELSRTGDELLYERGLLRRYSGSIPFDKVQTLTVADNPLKRRFGYATLLIETAGYTPGGGPSAGSEAAVPLASAERVRALAADIEPFGEPAFERPPRRVRRRYAVRYLVAWLVLAGALFTLDAALGGGVVAWYAAALLLPVLPVAAHYKWKHRGYWLGENHVVTRNGFWRRRTRVVPHYRIQTVIDERTPFQRRWGIATVTIDTAGSLSLVGGDAAAVDVEAAAADRLRAELNERLRAALAARPRPGATGNAAGDDADGGVETGGDDDGDDREPSP